MTLEEKAKKHVEFITDKYKDDINASIQATTEYRGVISLTVTVKNDNMKIEVANMGTIEAISKYTDGKVAVLNFASYKHPGGGFMSGRMAQEEALCHESTLYPVLAAFPDYYNVNRHNLNYGLYNDDALYSKDILFNKYDLYADVITCACPNWGATRRHNITWLENIDTLKSRINFILRIAEDNHVDTLILGAWGCGVFKQDPWEVAKQFKEALKNHKHFKTVVFAIPGGVNYEVFKKVL